MATKTKDKYDKAIKYLTKNPEQIHDAWTDTNDHPAGCLFQYVTRTGKPRSNSRGIPCGCLTTIRRYISGEAETHSLTRAIRTDMRIPKVPERIRVKDLPVFAEWQRRIDKELNRG